MTERLELALGRSRLESALRLTALAALLAGIWALPLAPGWRLAASALWLVEIGLALRPGPGGTLLWDGSHWWLRGAGNRPLGTECRVAFVSGWLVVLGFRRGWRRHYLPVFADAVSGDGFRVLLVRARAGKLG
ncbi:MAG: hypothetical protein ACOY42_11530 [Pseudomonadota bacterium]